MNTALDFLVKGYFCPSLTYILNGPFWPVGSFSSGNSSKWTPCPLTNFTYKNILMKGVFIFNIRDRPISHRTRRGCFFYAQIHYPTKFRIKGVIQNEKN